MADPVQVKDKSPAFDIRTCSSPYRDQIKSRPTAGLISGPLSRFKFRSAANSLTSSPKQLARPLKPSQIIGLNQCTFPIPRSLKISSKIEDNDLRIIRKKLRVNKISHMKFNPSLENSEGARYFSHVYQLNNSLHIEGNPGTENDPRNLYQYILSKGLHNEHEANEMITHLRTGYNASEQREKYRRQVNAQRRKEHRSNLLEVDSNNIYMEFLEKLNANHGSSNQDEEQNEKIEIQTQKTLKKFLPNNFVSSFTLMRQKAEKAIENGFSYKIDHEADKTQTNAFQLLSPIEMAHKAKLDQKREEEERVKAAKRAQEEQIARQILEMQLLEEQAKRMASAKSQFGYTRAQLAIDTKQAGYMLRSLDLNLQDPLSSTQLHLFSPNSGSMTPGFREQQSKWKSKFNRRKQSDQGAQNFSQQLEGTVKDGSSPPRQITMKTNSKFFESGKKNHQKRVDSPFASNGSILERDEVSHLPGQSGQHEIMPQKKDAAIRPWTQQQKTTVGQGLQTNQKLKIKQKENQKKNPFNDYVGIGSSSMVRLKHQKRDISTTISNYRNIRNSSTAVASSANSVRTHNRSPMAQSVDFSSLPNSNVVSERFSPEKKAKLALNQESLFQIVKDCESTNASWLQDSEAERMKLLKETHQNQRLLRTAIDHCLDSNKLESNKFDQQALKFDHLVGSIGQIMEQNSEIQEYDFDNFLSPKVLNEFKQSNFDQTSRLIRHMSKHKIWQPDVFKLTKKSQVADSIMKIGQK